MIDLDDDYLPEEAKQIALNLRKTTPNIVRQFLTPQMQLKLKALGDSRSNEYAGFIESFEQLKNLWWTKLTTPLEEEQSIKEQLRILVQRTQKLNEIRDQKKEHLQKYEEESKEQKEQREYEIQNLKKQIADENAAKDGKLRELNDYGRARNDALEKRHKERVDALSKRINELDSTLNQVKLKNKTEETKMREEFKKADRLYSENLANYDAEMKDQTKSKEQALDQFEQIHQELVLVEDDYKSRLDDRKQREEILTLMKKKNDEQEKQMNLLHRASDWVQAHWRGLLARREMERARKGKKKKKKKK